MNVETLSGHRGGHPGRTLSVTDPAFISRLRTLSFEMLHRMYVPSERLFVFRLQRDGDQLVPQGISLRYTAITLLGLAGESREALRVALHGDDPLAVCDRLAQAVVTTDNVGDVALALWAAHRIGYANLDPIRERMLALKPLDGVCTTVELSWVLMASCVDPKLAESGFVHRAATRLVSAFNPASGIFPHVVGAVPSGLRAHVSCFADFVYPIQALAAYHEMSGDGASLAAATRCADQACHTQGPDGQWWWHFDARTGEVVERFPVYTVHQHGMGPMALFALEAAGGPVYADAVERSLGWLTYAPEIGRSLIDEEAKVIWRKVARKEPRKLARKLQAVASYAHPSMRAWGVDAVLPARVVDYECRPYELGWLLFAWPEEHVAKWTADCQRRTRSELTGA